jgi:sirohydrochlorin cobaltochelatase
MSQPLSSQTSGVLLVGHGSPEAIATAQFLHLAERAAAQLSTARWQPALLEHARPTIAEGIDLLVGQGVSEVALVPLLLFAAGHAKRDLPAHLVTAQALHPHVNFVYGRVLGVDQGMVRTCARLLAQPQADTAVLLVGRGSSDPEATADLAEVARLLRAQSEYPWVEVAYLAIAEPTVAQGLAQCLAQGARRVILLPYLLFAGVLMDGLERLLEQWRPLYPDVSFELAGERGLGAGPEVVDLAVARAREALGQLTPPALEG